MPDATGHDGMMRASNSVEAIIGRKPGSICRHVRIHQASLDVLKALVAGGSRLSLWSKRFARMALAVGFETMTDGLVNRPHREISRMNVLVGVGGR
jgi:hypothetical protein